MADYLMPVDLNDPKQATKHFIKEAKIRGLTPTQAVTYVVGSSDCPDNIYDWHDACQFVFEVMCERYGGQFDG